MELPGSIYLYALATVSITFVGFSALLLIFRQAMGGATTKYERSGSEEARRQGTI